LPAEGFVAADDAFDARIVEPLPDREAVDVPAHRVDAALTRDEEALEETLARLGGRLDDEVVVLDAEPLGKVARNTRVVAGFVERGAPPPRDRADAVEAAASSAERKQQAAAVDAPGQRHEPAREVELEARSDIVDERLELAAEVPRVAESGRGGDRDLRCADIEPPRSPAQQYPSAGRDPLDPAVPAAARAERPGRQQPCGRLEVRTKVAEHRDDRTLRCRCDEEIIGLRVPDRAACGRVGDELDVLIVRAKERKAAVRHVGPRPAPMRVGLEHAERDARAFTPAGPG